MLLVCKLLLNVECIKKEYVLKLEGKDAWGRQNESIREVIKEGTGLLTK